MSVSGAGLEGSAEACETPWSCSAGYAPSAGLYPFVQSVPPPPPTPALSALDITPRMFTLGGRRVGGPCHPSSRFNCGERPCVRRVALTVRFTLGVGATVTFALERALPGRLTRGRCTAPTRSDRRHRPCTHPVMLHGTTVINGRAGADAFTFTGKIAGRTLVPGSYRLLATPTADGIAGHSSRRHSSSRAERGRSRRCCRK